MTFLNRESLNLFQVELAKYPGLFEQRSIRFPRRSNSLFNFNFVTDTLRSVKLYNALGTSRFASNNMSRGENREYK